MSIAEKLTTIAKNQEKVYDAGKDAEWNKFWDIFQDNGNRTDYSKAFWKGFTNDNFKPKYSMTPTTAENMFWGSKIKGDLEQILADCGVTLDFSKATDIRYLFSQANFTVIPEVNVTSCNTSNSAYYQAVFGWNTVVETVRKVILPNDGSMIFTYWFSSANKLKNITFEGTIGKSIDFQWSKLLSRASIENIVECLSQNSTEQTLTFSQTAVDNAFTTAEWNTLIAGKTNWTFSLI